MQVGLDGETFENVGRVPVNVWAVEYLYGTVGVLNSLEMNKQAPHMKSMEALQTLDNTESFQKPEWSPSQIRAPRASTNGKPVDQSQ